MKSQPYYEITTQIPLDVHIALKRGAKIPRLEYPPIRHNWFSGKAFTEGIQKHSIDEVTVKIYSPAKTVTDCFKYRNKIGRCSTRSSTRMLAGTEMLHGRTLAVCKN